VLKKIKCSKAPNRMSVDPRPNNTYIIPRRIRFL
jgi:hypothetical protein